jgi:hypothetical protein
MTTVTVIIMDNVNEAGDQIVEMEGHMDPPNAIDLPPTPSLIVGSYIAANSESICKEAMRWFNAMSTGPATVDEPVVRAPQIFVPNQEL